MTDIQESVDAIEAVEAAETEKAARATKVKTKAKSATPDSVAALAAEGRVKIILEENDEIPPSGQFISVNGVGYLLIPGQPADVPVGVIEVLNNAVRDKPVLEGGRVVGYRQALRFPYRRLS